VNYLLDTNAAVALLRGRPAKVRERYRQADAAGDYLAVPSIVLFELWYGVVKSAQERQNSERLRVLLSGNLDLLDFDDQDARTAGQVRAALERTGMGIGAYDVLIAGQALRRGLTVVTANSAEFGRVSGLVWEDWSA
jgi:tRNA(fMet)-specific endonuclease VapC